MTTWLSLLCHAPTSAVRAAAFPADEPLDERGWQAAQAMSHKLARADRIWTSPALRAVQTASVLQLAGSIDPALRECDYGAWTGLTVAQVQASEPQALADWLADPAAAPHGGEHLLALIARVAVWMREQLLQPGHVVAVTHASVIRAAILSSLGAPPHAFWRIDVPPLGLAKLSGADGRWNVQALLDR